MLYQTEDGFPIRNKIGVIHPSLAWSLGIVHPEQPRRNVRRFLLSGKPVYKGLKKEPYPREKDILGDQQGRTLGMAPAP